MWDSDCPPTQTWGPTEDFPEVENAAQSSPLIAHVEDEDDEDESSGDRGWREIAIQKIQAGGVQANCGPDAGPLSGTSERLSTAATDDDEVPNKSSEKSFEKNFEKIFDESSEKDFAKKAASVDLFGDEPESRNAEEVVRLIGAELNASDKIGARFTEDAQFFAVGEIVGIPRQTEILVYGKILSHNSPSAAFRYPTLTIQCEIYPVLQKTLPPLLVAKLPSHPVADDNERRIFELTEDFETLYAFINGRSEIYVRSSLSFEGSGEPENDDTNGNGNVTIERAKGGQKKGPKTLRFKADQKPPSLPPVFIHHAVFLLHFLFRQVSNLRTSPPKISPQGIPRSPAKRVEENLAQAQLVRSHQALGMRHASLDKILVEKEQDKIAAASSEKKIEDAAEAGTKGSEPLNGDASDRDRDQSDEAVENEEGEEEEGISFGRKRRLPLRGGFCDQKSGPKPKRRLLEDIVSLQRTLWKDYSKQSRIHSKLLAQLMEHLPSPRVDSQRLGG